MRDRPAARAVAPPLSIWLFPGASLMAIERLPEGLVTVRCPGCGALMAFFGMPPATFVHESYGLPVPSAD